LLFIFNKEGRMHLFDAEAGAPPFLKKSEQSILPGDPSSELLAQYFSPSLPG
jgi:hypothetical protein